MARAAVVRGLRQQCGLSMPVALADYPRGARQEVHCLDLLRDNALIVAAPNRGASTAIMTMVTTAALLYRPERVQFYCIASSGPQACPVGGPAACGRRGGRF